MLYAIEAETERERGTEMYSHKSFNLYLGGPSMKKHLKMVMPCSKQDIV